MIGSHYQFYYSIKRFIPRRLQLFMRRTVLLRKREKYAKEWPINDKASSLPDGWTGWPDGKQFALVLTHDVDTQKGHDCCLQLADMEEKLGFRSSFNFVVNDYAVSAELRHELVRRGFEVGVHGLTHDCSLYKNEFEFQRQAARINQVLKEWNAVGFRSPAMYRNLEWLTYLDVEYDSSTFDTDPFEPQPIGVETIFPFRVQFDNKRKGYIELPYTMPQDFTLFVMFEERDIRIWIEKLDWIVSHGGMALVNVHPDYLHFSGKSEVEKYPAIYYQNLLEYIVQKYNGMYFSALPKEMAEFWKRNNSSGTDKSKAERSMGVATRNHETVMGDQMKD